MSSSSSAVAASADTGQWSSALPELGGITRAAMDPARIEAAMRDGYAAGHAAGHTDGYAAGYAAGEAAARADLAEDRRRLEAACISLGAQLRTLADAEDRIRAAYEASTVDAAIAIAEAVLGREVAASANPGREAILRAFAVAPGDAASASVRLHPADAARLGSLDDVLTGVCVEVVPDGRVEPGGCILQLGDTSVDATVGAALGRVREVLS